MTTIVTDPMASSVATYSRAPENSLTRLPSCRPWVSLLDILATYIYLPIYILATYRELGNLKNLYVAKIAKMSKIPLGPSFLGNVYPLLFPALVACVRVRWHMATGRSFGPVFAGTARALASGREGAVAA